MIGIALDRQVVEAGGFLSGNIHYERGDARRFIVAAEWETVGPGNRARGIARAKVILPQGEGSFPFRLKIPYEGPISFVGEVISIEWKLRARVDRKGADAFAEADFRVEPRT
jgi:hypothetical protein